MNEMMRDIPLFVAVCHSEVVNNLVARQSIDRSIDQSINQLIYLSVSVLYWICIARVLI